MNKQRVKNKKSGIRNKIDNSYFIIHNSKSCGFTLIELLIVMGIIAVIAAISIVALGGARASARDAKRKADLETIRSAIEIYKADCNTYPNPWTPTSGSSLTASCTGSSNTYIQSVPGDPTGGNYCYWSNGASYCICANLEENPATPQSCTGCGTCDYRVVP